MEDLGGLQVTNSSAIISNLQSRKEKTLQLASFERNNQRNIRKFKVKYASEKKILNSLIRADQLCRTQVVSEKHESVPLEKLKRSSTRIRLNIKPRLRLPNKRSKSVVNHVQCPRNKYFSSSANYYNYEESDPLQDFAYVKNLDFLREDCYNTGNNDNNSFKIDRTIDGRFFGRSVLKRNLGRSDSKNRTEMLKPKANLSKFKLMRNKGINLFRQIHNKFHSNLKKRSRESDYEYVSASRQEGQDLKDVGIDNTYQLPTVPLRMKSAHNGIIKRIRKYSTSMAQRRKGRESSSKRFNTKYKIALSQNKITDFSPETRGVDENYRSPLSFTNKKLKRTLESSYNKETCRIRLRQKRINHSYSSKRSKSKDMIQRQWVSLYENPCDFEESLVTPVPKKIIDQELKFPDPIKLILKEKYPNIKGLSDTQRRCREAREELVSKNPQEGQNTNNFQPDYRYQISFREFSSKNIPAVEGIVKKKEKKVKLFKLNKDLNFQEEGVKC